MNRVVSLRNEAIERIAAYWQSFVVCMPNMKPRKFGECDGPVEIDHRFGGGKRDAGAKMYRAIVDGKRDLSFFRLLCRRHNRQRTNDVGEANFQIGGS
jgi:hypothetical protein